MRSCSRLKLHCTQNNPEAFRGPIITKRFGVKEQLIYNALVDVIGQWTLPDGPPAHASFGPQKWTALHKTETGETRYLNWLFAGLLLPEWGKYHPGTFPRSREPVKLWCQELDIMSPSSDHMFFKHMLLSSPRKTIYYWKQFISCHAQSKECTSFVF